jgi:hypothetical protein
VWLAPNVAHLYEQVTTDGVFKKIAPDQLPPIEVTLEFPALPDDTEGTHLDAELGALDRLIEDAARQGLTLPASYLAFMRDPQVAARIPNVCGTYFMVGALEPVPDSSGPERLLRFLLDPQTFVWALLLEPTGHRVVFAYPDRRPGANYALTDITTCAPSFETFLTRFWIESSIAIALLREEPITNDELRTYLTTANRASRGAS